MSSDTFRCTPAKGTGKVIGRRRKARLILLQPTGETKVGNKQSERTVRSLRDEDVPGETFSSNSRTAREGRVLWLDIPMYDFHPVQVFQPRSDLGQRLFRFQCRSKLQVLIRGLDQI